MKSISTGLVIASLISCNISIASAQTSSSALPTREQIDIPKSELPTQPAQISVNDQTKSLATCPFEKSELTMTLDSLNFIQPDKTALPSEIALLLSDLAPPSGEQPISSLCELRDEAITRLSNAGYIATVTIPSQNISKTTRSADLMIILGKLVDITISGDISDSQANALESRIERLKDVTPLRTGDIERELLLASDNPALNVAMSLKSANNNAGELIGVLTVTRKTHSIVANLQNTGSKTIGRETASVRAEYYGLLNAKDIAFIGASTTLDFDEQQTVQGGYYSTLSNDLRLGGSLTLGWSDPDLGDLDFRTESLIAGIDARYPLIRSVGKSLYLDGGLEIINQESTLRGGEAPLPLTKDKLRVAYLSLSGGLSEPRRGGGEAWSLAGNLSYRQGLDIFDASQRGETDDSGFFTSRAQGDPTASVLRAGIDARYWPTRSLSISTSIKGQLSSAPLLAFEEFSVGNLTLGRGYDPGATAGDEAIGLRIEPALWLPIKADKMAFQAFGFGDVVRIWNQDDFTSENGRSLRSIGGGIRTFVGNNIALDVTYAHPLDAELNIDGAKDASDRLFASLTVNFGAH